MAELKFRLKRYNEGGFLNFLKNNPYQTNALLSGVTSAISSFSQPGSNPEFASFSNEFSNNKAKKKGIDVGLDFASQGAASIPAVGGFISAGLQGVKAISDLSSSDEDEFGVHKSSLLAGIDPQDQLRKDRDRFKTSQLMSGIEASNAVGASSRNAVGGYKAPAYGRKGMKLRTKFSKPSC